VGAGARRRDGLNEGAAAFIEHGARGMRVATCIAPARPTIAIHRAVRMARFVMPHPTRPHRRAHRRASRLQGARDVVGMPARAMPRGCCVMRDDHRHLARPSPHFD
jgi:hypothetical protein